MVANAPIGTKAAVFDVVAAFRNVPAHPSVHPFLAVSLAGAVHLDHCLNFSASPCPGVWGCIADAMVEIFQAKGITAIIKWLMTLFSSTTHCLAPLSNHLSLPMMRTTCGALLCRNYAVTHHNSIIEHLHNHYYVTTSRTKV